jgi:hypothetical protein
LSSDGESSHSTTNNEQDDSATSSNSDSIYTDIGVLEIDMEKGLGVKKATAVNDSANTDDRANAMECTHAQDTMQLCHALSMSSSVDDFWDNQGSSCTPIQYSTMHKSSPIEVDDEEHSSSTLSSETARVRPWLVELDPSD